MRMCLLNKYRQLVNEKYALQQYEGRVSDAFWSDIKELNMNLAEDIYKVLSDL